MLLILACKLSVVLEGENMEKYQMPVLMLEIFSPYLQHGQTKT